MFTLVTMGAHSSKSRAKHFQQQQQKKTKIKNKKTNWLNKYHQNANQISSRTSQAGLFQTSVHFTCFPWTSKVVIWGAKEAANFWMDAALQRSTNLDMAQDNYGRWIKRKTKQNTLILTLEGLRCLGEHHWILFLTHCCNCWNPHTSRLTSQNA